MKQMLIATINKSIYLHKLEVLTFLKVYCISISYARVHVQKQTVLQSSGVCDGSNWRNMENANSMAP